MDSDTYIFKDRVRWLVEEMELPSLEHIAMAKDGCKDEYNSGVMFFKPNLEVFRSMLLMVTQRRREQILDQTLINDYYRSKIVPIDRKFNCMETVGVHPGMTKPGEPCADVVVAHFTGHPKPTSPERLELVRRPGAPDQVCKNTDLGACRKWSEYYCDIRTHSQRLSPELRNELWSSGPCCHAGMMTRKDKRMTAEKFGVRMSDENFSEQLNETCQEPRHEWIENVSYILPMDFTPLDNRTSFYRELQQPHHHTAIVTFAGKNNPEYIDGAVMLGISAQKYLPEYVRVAMIIEGMPWKMQILLKRAGWKLITVPNWEGDYCGEACDLEFLGRWHDSFEKINAFRLPFKRVLFMDSDTYIFKDRVRWLVEEMELPSLEHIAMAKDGCKDEYNSGVMFFKPNLEVFRSMLLMVTQRRREQILDQNLINDYYRGKIFPIDRKFNCVDTVGIQPGQTKPCDQHCTKGAVIAHFTGHPKPTSAKRRLLELVRRPGAPALACMHTNFGSCGKWSEYYCDIRRYTRSLSTGLQDQLKNTGSCCHPHMMTGKEKKKAAKGNNLETCQECPATLKMWAPNPNLAAVGGVYVKTSLPSRKFNGGRPIYLNMDSDWKHNPVYLFFMQERMAWTLGADYRVNYAFGFAAMEAQCPRDTKFWSFHNGTAFVRSKFNIQAHANGANAPKDTNHIAWNVHKRAWQRETIVWEDGQLGKATASGEDDAAAGGLDAGQNATEGEEAADVGAENATAAGAEEDDGNATEKGDIDADENETIEVDEKGDKNLTEGGDIDADEKETTDIVEKHAETAVESEDDETPSSGED